MVYRLSGAVGVTAAKAPGFRRRFLFELARVPDCHVGCQLERGSVRLVLQLGTWIKSSNVF